MFRRIFYGWYVIIVSGLGVGCGLAVFISATVGLLVAPLHRDLGFTPQQIFNAPIVATTTTVFIAPFLGKLIDRIGSKKVIIFAFIAEGLITASFNFLNTSVFWFLFRYSLFAALATGTTAVAFAPLISKWFEAKRGTALGITLAGIGLGGFVWSLLTQHLFDRFGWRHTFLIEGALMLFIMAPLQATVLRETPLEMGLAMDGLPLSPKTRILAGMTFREARNTRQYWLLLVFALFVGFGGQALALHLVSILRVNHESASMAAATQASLWMALVFGRLLTGWLMDRFYAPVVGAIFLLPALAGVGMLAVGATGVEGFAAAMLVGVASGAEVDVIAYLASRSFGLRYFSSIYSTYFAAFSLGGGLGPSLTSYFVKSYGYPHVLIGVGVIFLLATVLLLSFPRHALSARSMVTIPDLDFGPETT